MFDEETKLQTLTLKVDVYVKKVKVQFSSFLVFFQVFDHEYEVDAYDF